MLEVVAALERELGIAAEIDWQPEQTGDVHRTWGDISAARDALGYSPKIGFDDGIRRTAWQETLDGLAPGGIGYLGLDERTGVICRPIGADARDGQVAGAGSAYWFARGAFEPVIGQHGDVLRLPT